MGHGSRSRISPAGLHPSSPLPLVEALDQWDRDNARKWLSAPISMKSRRPWPRALSAITGRRTLAEPPGPVARMLRGFFVYCADDERHGKVSRKALEKALAALRRR